MRLSDPVTGRLGLVCGIGLSWRRHVEQNQSFHQSQVQLSIKMKPPIRQGAYLIAKWIFIPQNNVRIRISEGGRRRLRALCPEGEKGKDKDGATDRNKPQVCLWSSLWFFSSISETSVRVEEDVWELGGGRVGTGITIFGFSIGVRQRAGQIWGLGVTRGTTWHQRSWDDTWSRKAPGWEEFTRWTCVQGVGKTAEEEVLRATTRRLLSVN